MQRLQRYASSWGLDLRDLVLISALAIVAILPVSHDIERASNPGPVARVAMSWEIVNHRALEERTLPLWNPYQFGGRPHLANPEMLSLYPPHMLLRFLPLPLFVAVSFALHAWLAAAGTYLAARLLRVSRLACARGRRSHLVRSPVHLVRRHGVFAGYVSARVASVDRGMRAAVCGAADVVTAARACGCRNARVHRIGVESDVSPGDSDRVLRVRRDVAVTCRVVVAIRRRAAGDPCMSGGGAERGSNRADRPVLDDDARSQRSPSSYPAE